MTGDLPARAGQIAEQETRDSVSGIRSQRLRGGRLCASEIVVPAIGAVPERREELVAEIGAEGELMLAAGPS